MPNISAGPSIAGTARKLVATVTPPHGDLPLARRFAREVVVPVLIVAVVAACAAGYGLRSATHTSDEISAERQTERVRRSIDESIDEIAYQEQSDAQWAPLARTIVKQPLDLDWLDENCGAWLHDMFGHDQVYILDPQDRPVYAAIDGKRVPTASFATGHRAIGPMIDAVRGRPAPIFARHSRVGGSHVSGPTVRTRLTTVHASDLVLVADRPAAASVMQIVSPAQDVAGQPPTPFLMIVVKFIDGPYLAGIGHRTVIDGLRFSRLETLGPEERAVPIRNEAGRDLGHLFWQPNLPGQRIMHALAPVTVATVGVLISALAFLVRSLWRKAYALDRTMRELKEREWQAQYAATHDALTGVPNRLLFADRLGLALTRTRRGERIGLLVVDIDHFKEVNDTLGHLTGDRLLVEVAARLSGATRATDTVGRFGGDEFLVLLGHLRAPDDIERVCGKIFEAMRRPFDLPDARLVIGVSIGIAVAPDAATEPAELLRKADIALYRAKADGRNCHRYFALAMDQELRHRHGIEQELRSALSGGGGLRVYYQPVLNADGRTVIGLEALIRWVHPVRGLLGPDDFIPIAERSDLIHALGEHVLADAARVAASRPGQFVAVNLSPTEIRAPGFASRALDIVRDAHCDPAAIEFEITETVLLGEDETCGRALEALRHAGFRIALDDFGIGYSNISYLRRFRVDTLKIDRSFIASLGRDAEAEAIVTALVTLGHAMGLRITAEGVETQEQRLFLSQIGCDALQGYLFSPAVPEQALAALPNLVPGGVSDAA